MKMQWVYRTARTSILAPNGAGPSAYEMLFGFSPRLGSSATTCTDAFWARFWSERLEKLRQLNDEVLEQWKEQQRETTPSRKVAAGTIVYVKRQHVDRELATNTGEKTHISRRLQPLADGPFVLVVKDIGAALQVRSLAPPPTSAGADTGDEAREKDNKAFCTICCARPQMEVATPFLRFRPLCSSASTPAFPPLPPQCSIARCI